MAFAEKIKKLRIEKGVTQYEMAQNIGVTTRSIQNYENGAKMPRTQSIIYKIADYFDVSYEDLMSPEDYCVIAALERGGSSAEKELRKVMTELCALFSGGKLSENDKENVVNTLNEIYWDSRKKAQEKYTPGGSH